MGIGLTPGFKYYNFFPYILKQIYELPPQNYETKPLTEWLNDTGLLIGIV